MTHTKWSTIKSRRMKEPGFALGYEDARRAHLLAQQVREIRLARGLSQADLAKRLRTTQSAISRLEMGDMPPSLRTLTRIGDALGLELVIGYRERPTSTARRRPASRRRSG